VAGEYYKIVDSHISGSDVSPLVHRLTAGKQSRNEKMQAILEYLDKEVRYTGIEFGEAAIVPHSPSETLTHKYGDCKDKATLLVTMLRTADIPAYVALLNAGARMDVPADLPGMGLFDHAIVFVPGDPDLWIDSTDDYARLGQLPVADQGRMALIVRSGSNSLVRTAEMPSQNNVLFELREIYLSENGPARVVETSQPRGIFESEYRSFYADKQNQNHRDNVTNYVKSQYLAEKLDRLDRSDPSDFSKQFELVLETDKAKRGFTDLDSAVAAIRLESLFYRLPNELQEREAEDKPDPIKPKKKRTADYQLPEPFVAEWHYKIVPPLGFQPKQLPQDVKLSLGPATLSEQFAADKTGTVQATLRLDTVKRRFTVVEATELRNKVAELRGTEAILINFELTSQALLKQGKVKESFQSYRSLIAQHPKEAVHHLQIAKALLEAGMGEAAREEGRLAVKLDPNTALAEETLADILEFDLVGRKFRPGSDYAGAATAFRAAAKLDPEDKNVPANLAFLSEYNEDGARYGPGAKLKEAVSEYKEITQEKLVGLGLASNLAFALFYAGEFAEARKNADTLNPQPKSLIVACEAAMNGSQAGIAEANKRSSGGEDFKQVSRTAGEMLMNVRKYTLAADLLQAGASGENAARSMGLASLLRNARFHEDLKFGNSPEDLVKRFALLSMDPTMDLEKWKALSSKNAQIVMQDMDPEEIKNVLNTGVQLRRSLARSGSPPDATVDILMESIEPKGEGNDASGYREKLQVPGGKKLTFFVVKEAGQYKILDAAEKPNSIGLEILDRVAAKNFDGAKTMLDWTREELHLEGGDDPLLGDAFPRFWTKGKEADGEQMKLAAAAMLVDTKPTAKRGISILEEARKSADTDEKKTNLDIALSIGYTYLQDYEKLLPVSAELVKQYPESKAAFISATLAFNGLGRFDEANNLAEQRLKRMPDDMDASRALVRTAVFREDYRAAYDLDRKLADAGKAEAGDLNGLAWGTLFFNRAEGPDIETAIKATQLSQNNFHILHTLACLYAEAGKTKEAREVLIQAMDLQNLDEPDPDYWYALGRIAEQYGEREVALSDYAKVTKPKEALRIPNSTYRLAQNRLKVLQPSPR
jgi:tetratricopeptide (TPR) repeat protein